MIRPDDFIDDLHVHESLIYSNVKLENGRLET